MSSLGWAQKSLSEKEEMVFSTQRYTWWKRQRVCGKSGSCVQDHRPPLSKHTGSSSDFLFVGSSDPDRKCEWKHRTKLWWCDTATFMPGWRVGKAKVTTWKQLEESRITDCGHQELGLYRCRFQSYRSKIPETLIISRSIILREVTLLLNSYLSCVLFFRAQFSLLFSPFTPLLPIAFPQLICHKYVAYVRFFGVPSFNSPLSG